MFAEVRLGSDMMFVLLTQCQWILQVVYDVQRRRTRGPPRLIKPRQEPYSEDARPYTQCGVIEALRHLLTGGLNFTLVAAALLKNWQYEHFLSRDPYHGSAPIILPCPRSIRNRRGFFVKKVASAPDIRACYGRSDGSSRPHAPPMAALAVMLSARCCRSKAQNQLSTTRGERRSLHALYNGLSGHWPGSCPIYVGNLCVPETPRRLQVHRQSPISHRYPSSPSRRALPV